MEEKSTVKLGYGKEKYFQDLPLTRSLSSPAMFVTIMPVRFRRLFANDWIQEVRCLPLGFSLLLDRTWRSFPQRCQRIRCASLPDGMPPMNPAPTLKTTRACPCLWFTTTRLRLGWSKQRKTLKQMEETSLTYASMINLQMCVPSIWKILRHTHWEKNQVGRWQDLALTSSLNVITSDKNNFRRECSQEMRLVVNGTNQFLRRIYRIVLFTGSWFFSSQRKPNRKEKRTHLNYKFISLKLLFAFPFNFMTETEKH